MIEAEGGTRPIVLAGRHGTELVVRRLILTVVEGPDRDQHAEGRSPSLIAGSDPLVELPLQDPTVSRRHVSCSVTPEGVRVEDLGSRNGTWVGGVRITAAVVPSGTQIRIGATTVRVDARPDRFTVFPDAEPDGPTGMLGKSLAMREIFALVKQLARTDLPVLITGETGTGKELVARALHECGPRRSKPFQVLDCAAVVPELLRSEIFGHQKGAFTGADRMAAGILESAAGGTVFLDELGEMDVSVQPNLLRALETRRIQRIGGRAQVAVDFRLVAATNRDLVAMCDRGRFRKDLYYRISCVTIRLSALRERSEDVSMLALKFLDDCASRHQMPTPELGQEALEWLERHPWPGNVRELRNVMEAACVRSDGNPILAEDLKRFLASQTSTAPPHQSLDEAERVTIEAALNGTSWNCRAAARRLGLSPTTLYDRIRKYNLSQGRATTADDLPAGSDSPDGKRRRSARRTS